MEPLKSCPFCGGEADYLPDRLMAPGAEPPVFCDGCHASALDAAAWNRRASGWQPISTAPRDGTRILGSTPFGVVVVRWTQEECLSDCCRAISCAGWYGEGGETYPAHNTGATEADNAARGQPAHWHPLPPAPEPTP
jgi:hypothetical protein